MDQRKEEGVGGAIVGMLSTGDSRSAAVLGKFVFRRQQAESRPLQVDGRARPRQHRADAHGSFGTKH